jgi:23S rRNA (cytosine1962-C5)-methyltransferase
LPVMHTCEPAPNLEQALRESWRRRQPLHDDPDIDVYRILHGYTEGCCGLNIEKFGPVARVVWKNKEDLESDVLCRTLVELGGFESIVVKRTQRCNNNPIVNPVECLHGHGAAADVETEVHEYELRFRVQPFADANSGLFLDARPARQWIRQHSHGRRVLNLFAYTGSLGIAAAAGGAAAITHVDGKRNALKRARANHELNNLPIDDRSLLRGNVYTHLPRAIRNGQRFDAVILDPPPRLPRSKARKPQGQDYTRLARWATDLLEDGGWLLCFFSRYDQSRERYEEEVVAASDGDLRPWWRGTSGDDFPEEKSRENLRLTAWIKG